MHHLDYFSGKNILITGGAGYLATNLVKLLSNIDCRIVRFDRSGSQFCQPTGKVQLVNVEGDVRLPQIWDSLIDNIDVIFHFAAQTSVYVAEQNPQNDYEINVAPIFRLLETCRQRSITPCIVFSGTVTEMGISESLPVDETFPDHPITFYDLHKWMAENYLKYYTRIRAVRGVTLRLANVYGPGPASSNADRGVLNLMVRRALQGEPITVYGKGEYLRDYVYVEDVANAFLAAAMNVDKVIGKHFVIGSEQGYTIKDAFTLVKKRVEIKTNNTVAITHIDEPATLSDIERRNFVANTRCFREATGWKPKYSLEAGIDMTIDSYLGR